MTLPNVASGDPHVSAHNAERAQINNAQQWPSYLANQYTKPWDARTGRFNSNPDNSRIFAAAFDKVSDGSGRFHDVFIGASDMSMYDGSALKAPFSWPETYRKTLGIFGLPMGGTGLLPCMDSIGQNDTRLVYTGAGWANYNGAFKYNTGTGVLTFTPDIDGVFFLIYDAASGKGAFTVKIGAAAPVTVTPSGAAATGDGSNQIAMYTVAGTVSAGTAVVITNTGGTMVPYFVGTIATTGYIKHNFARSSMGATRAADTTYFTAAATDGAWDPTVNATAAAYSVPARQTYKALSLAGITANRVTISLLANDIVGGKTTAQITAGLSNIIAQFPGAQVRIIVPWQYGAISDVNYEAAAVALWDFAVAGGYQLVDQRFLFGKFSDMQAAGILGPDGYHLKVGAAQRFGRKLALADLLAA